MTDDKEKDFMADLFENDPILGANKKSKDKEPTSVPVKESKEKVEKEAKPPMSLVKWLGGEKEENTEPKDDGISLLIPEATIVEREVNGPNGNPVKRKIHEFSGKVTLKPFKDISGVEFVAWISKNYPIDIIGRADPKALDDYKKRKEAFEKLQRDYFDRAYPSLTATNLKYRN